MKNIKGYMFIVPVIILSLLCFIACDNTDSMSGNTPPTSQTSKLAIRLIDSPGDYDEVNLEVVDILIRSNSNMDDDQGWVSIGLHHEPIQYNILSLTGGANALIADTLLPSGEIGQIRLVLGDNNNVVIDGVTHHLNTPSAQQSGLKLALNQTLKPGLSYDFTLDFDADKSIVKAGNSGNYNLHPVLRVFATVSLGKIKGMITPTGFQVKASVMVGDTEISSFTNEMGAFEISGLPAGTYIVKLTPDPKANYAEATVPNVIVTDGTTTDVGNILLVSTQ